MKENKINKFLLCTSILSMIILIIGGSFSYFSATARSKADALSVEAGKITLGLGTSLKFPQKKLIPTNDSDIMTAYQQECTDDYGFGSCLAFDLELSNFANEQNIIGTITFETENITNLSYLVLDDSDNIYLDKTKVEPGTKQSLGNNFTISDGSSLLPAKKKFTLLVWLTNLEDEIQEDKDAKGSFTGTVTFQTTKGGSLTGTISGIN